MGLDDRNSVANIIHTLRNLPNRIMLAIGRDSCGSTDKNYNRDFTADFKIDKLGRRSHGYNRKNDKHIMRGLLISNIEQKKIKDLIDFANDNVLDTDHMLDIKNGIKKPVGADPNFVLFIPIGFRVVYSVEQIGNNKQRHISISVEGGHKNKIPNPAAVEAILLEFDMDREDQNGMFLEEEVGVVNVVAPYEYTGIPMSDDLKASLLSSDNNEKDG